MGTIRFWIAAKNFLGGRANLPSYKMGLRIDGEGVGRVFRSLILSLLLTGFRVYTGESKAQGPT